MPEDKEKEINPFLIDKKGCKVVGIVSTKINIIINYQVVNGAVAKRIRQAIENT